MSVQNLQVGCERNCDAFAVEVLAPASPHGDHTVSGDVDCEPGEVVPQGLLPRALRNKIGVGNDPDGGDL
eukprot:13477583-Alexandrium_andersonii.AAC.1